MKFKFENLGPIKSGDVEVGDLTVICGRNNVGKTYVSHSIWTFFNQRMKGIIADIFDDDFVFDSRVGEFSYKVGLKDISVIFKKRLFEDIATPRVLASSFNVGEEVFKNTKVDFSFHERLELDETGVVAINDDGAGNEIFKSLRNASFDRTLSFFKGMKATLSKKKGDDFVSYDYIIDESFFEEGSAKENKEIPGGVFSILLSGFVASSIMPRARIITSERTGVALFTPALDKKASEFSKEIAILNREDVTKIKDIFNLSLELDRIGYYPTYAEPIQDNIDKVRQISSSSKERSEICDKPEVAAILKDLVGGTFESTSEGISYNVNGTSVPLHIVSSSAKSLFLIEHYIKREAKVGDLLIIDEPELNLHMDNQVKMARLIAALVNCGIKILITTHSDHLLRELNNLIMLSSKNIGQERLSELLNGFSINRASILEPGKVKAAVVSAESRIIFDMPVSERGIEMALFNKEINENNSKIRSIYKAMKEG